MDELNDRRLPMSGMPTHAHVLIHEHTYTHAFIPHVQTHAKENEEIEVLLERQRRGLAAHRATELKLSRAHRCKAVNVVQMGRRFHRTHKASGLSPTTSQNQVCTAMIPALRR